MMASYNKKQGIASFLTAPYMDEHAIDLFNDSISE